MVDGVQNAVVTKPGVAGHNLNGPSRTATTRTFIRRPLFKHLLQLIGLFEDDLAHLTPAELLDEQDWVLCFERRGLRARQAVRGERTVSTVSEVELNLRTRD